MAPCPSESSQRVASLDTGSPHVATDLVLGSFQDTEGPAAMNVQGEPTGERLPLDRPADVVKTQKNTVIEEPRMAS